MSNPTVCVIIPAKNAEQTIEKCLRSVLASTLTRETYEVIVVDDHSTDSTAKKIREQFPAVKVVANPKKGPSAARNYAAHLTGAAYLAFTDSDCIVERPWLEELLKSFSCGAFAGAGGVQETPEDDSAFGKKVGTLLRKIGFLTGYLKQPAAGAVYLVSHNPSCCVMYARDVFIKEGGFLENFYPGEDVELDYRLRKKGYWLGCAPQAKVYHYRGGNGMGFLKKMYRYGMTQGMLVRRYGLFRKIHYLPLFVLGGIAGLSVFVSLDGARGGVAFCAVLVLLFGYFNFNVGIVFLAVAGGAFWHAGFFRGLCARLPGHRTE